MKIVKASKDDHLNISDTKTKMLEIYNKLITEAQTSNPDTTHDILLNPEGPATENQLEGQRFFKKNYPNSPSPDNTRGFEGEVGQQGDDGINRAKGGEVGQMGPQEVSTPFGGDAVRSQYEEIGGATGDQGMIGDKDANPELHTNYQKDSLGPDSANSIEKQLNGEPIIGQPPNITNNKKWQKETVVGPPVSRRKRTKKG